MKLITICINSFNRHRLLHQRIRELISLPTDIHNIIDVKILDASFQQTPDFILEDCVNNTFSLFRKQCSLSEGYYFLASHVETPYTWMLSDDDSINQSAFIQFCSYLTKNQNVDLFLVNSQLSLQCLKIPTPLHFYDNIVQPIYCDINHLFDNYIYPLSYIGSLVLRTVFWKNTHLLRSSYFPHLNVLVDSDVSTISVTNFSIFNVHVGLSSWHHKSFVVWHIDFPSLFENASVLSLALRSRLLKKYSNLSVYQLVYYCIIGQSTLIPRKYCPPYLYPLLRCYSKVTRSGVPSYFIIKLILIFYPVKTLFKNELLCFLESRS